MDKKKSVINISLALFFKFFILILTIFTTRTLINYVGNSANGVYSLFTSIIGVLSIADLGVGVAISFCMYKPIVNDDKETISALYVLFIKIYRIVGAIILIVGLLITPLIPFLAKENDGSFNLYFTFILMLLSVVLNYMYSAKTSLINAYKNQYITTSIHSIAQIIMMIGQIILLIYTKSFELYLVARLVSIVIEWVLTNIYFNKNHKKLINYNAKISEQLKHEVVAKTKAMFMHKIGGLLVNTADSLIISAFIGVIILGKYSNYLTIMSGMTSVIVLFFTPLTAIVGHLCVKDDKQEIMKYFNFFYAVNFIVGVIFFLGYYAIIDDVIAICFSPELLLSKDISFVITLNYFIQFMRQACLLFRDATGTFYNDRYKPLIEGIVNIILSVIFVNFFGITGVIISTIVTNVLICHTVEPFVLFKYGFNHSPKNYYIKNNLYFIIFALLLLLLNYVHVSNSNVWISLLINGCIAVGVGMVPVIFVVLLDKDFKQYVFRFLKKLKMKK